MTEFLKLAGRLVIKITAWPFFAFLFVSVFMPAAMHKAPDYGRGVTYHVWMPSRGGDIDGYVKPWVGYTYEITLCLAGGFVLLTAIWLVLYLLVVPRDDRPLYGKKGMS